MTKDEIIEILERMSNELYSIRNNAELSNAVETYTSCAEDSLDWAIACLKKELV
jgi:hypothetical protein